MNETEQTLDEAVALNERRMNMLTEMFEEKIKNLLDEDNKEEAYKYYHLHNFVVNAIQAYHMMKTFTMIMQGVMGFPFKE